MPQNDDLEWLTYETLFNVPAYRKTNERLSLNLYVLPRSDVTVFFRNYLPEDVLNTLTHAFFPEEADPLAHVAYCNHDWAWKPLLPLRADYRATECQLHASRAATARRRGEMREEGLDRSASTASSWRAATAPLSASPERLRLRLPTYVVLPYNHHDNNASDSLALGARHKRTAPCRKADARFSCACGKTASRSRVVRLVDSVRTALGGGCRWQDVVGPEALLANGFLPWNFAEAEQKRADFATMLAGNPDLQPDGVRAGPEQRPVARFDAELGPTDFSVKMGVIDPIDIVSNKRCLEDNSVLACLRSDLVAEIEDEIRSRGDHSRPDARIVVLTELLSVHKRFHVPWTAAPPEPQPEEARFGGRGGGLRYVDAHAEWVATHEAWKRENNREDMGHDHRFQERDGIQVRDLGPLRPSGGEARRIYIPPLSIPFIGEDLKTLTPEFFHLRDAGWRAFWNRSYATSLGRAKALFLLRYALQAFNPHPQNFLLEFTRTQPALPSWADPGIAPTGRVVFRDLADTALHREVAWALWGPGRPPPEGKLTLTDPVGAPLSTERGLLQAARIDLRREEKRAVPPDLTPFKAKVAELERKVADLERRRAEGADRALRELVDLRAAFGTLELPVLRAEFGEWIDCCAETGTEPGPEYRFTGTQLLWNRFSVFPNPAKHGAFSARMIRNAATLDTFANDPRVDPPANAGTLVPDLREPQRENFWKFWKLFLTTMHEWGRSHHREYVRTIERELGVNIAIDWKRLCAGGNLAPGAHLVYVLGNPTSDPYAGWEEWAISLVHALLKHPEGQKRVRRYHDSGWEARTTAFTLRFSGEPAGDGIPVRLKNLKDGSDWTDLTDRDGTLPFYDTMVSRRDDERGGFPSIRFWGRREAPDPAPAPPRAAAPEDYVIVARRGEVALRDVLAAGAAGAPLDGDLRVTASRP